MSMISDESEMDLEKCEQICEGEEIELPEDSSGGKLTYFLAPYFFEKTWILGILVSLSGVLLSSVARAGYFGLREFYDDPFKMELLDVFSPLWMIIHYFLFFIMFFAEFIQHRKNFDLETKVLQKLLKEVAEIDLTGDPLAWQRIASRVNCFSEETGNRYSLFSGGGHCMRFFVREIVKPIECQTYDIRCYCEGSTVVNFWKNPSNKALTERALANYNKSVENFGELSHIAEKDGCRDDIFENFCGIIKTSMLYFWAIEYVFSLIMVLAFIISMISYAIFRYPSMVCFL
ncbi:hypothetical protein ZYGR_0A00100 [Zygosaccharomyces rouxii]|uniref:Uncharacterized protein n=1 Tax=Zygosaccharomyces rouxii TaxID=4956 RepID=A0A1Q2ZSH5_ZYGRO|nr:hypothetical protein ZYGR_0A00100 [Zygosaccharomyces rouxii]